MSKEHKWFTIKQWDIEFKTSKHSSKKDEIYKTLKETIKELTFLNHSNLFSYLGYNICKEKKSYCFHTDRFIYE